MNATNEIETAVSNLTLHVDSGPVTLAQLALVPTPAPTDTWFPTPHIDVVTATSDALVGAGFQIAKASFGVAREGKRFFGTIDLTSGLADGVTLSVGIRNSNDRSFPLGFCAGTRVFVCDNLSFVSDLIVSRKHTKYGRDRFREAISAAVQGLVQFQVVERQRMDRLSKVDVREIEAESFILRSWENGLLSHLAVPQVIKEWREPRFVEFQPRTAWSLVNAYTTVLGPRAQTNPQRYADLTMQLNRLADGTFGIAS